MTLNLTLPPELGAQLADEARRRGMTADEYAARVLAQHLSPGGRPARVAALLQSWIDDGDAQEQRETGDYLVRVLDEDRLSERKLFPPDMKGISW